MLIKGTEETSEWHLSKGQFAHDQKSALLLPFTLRRHAFRRVISPLQNPSKSKGYSITNQNWTAHPKAGSSDTDFGTELHYVLHSASHWQKWQFLPKPHVETCLWDNPLTIFVIWRHKWSLVKPVSFEDGRPAASCYLRMSEEGRLA